MMKSKQPADVLGNQIKCPNFNQCPLCYGCRNFSTSDLNCLQCLKNKKKNICDTKKHNNNLISNFITKNKINIKEKINFKSNKGN